MFPERVSGLSQNHCPDVSRMGVRIIPDCAMKEIADLCGIEKNLTFHLARHTFATTVTLSKGVPIESVSKMLGHTNIRTTQIYARITDEKIGLDMKKLASKLKDSNFSYAQL